MQILFFVISLFASVAGAICGIGGGVIIKPLLDFFHLTSVSAISFLSGCTVLSMSCYSVIKGLLAHDNQVDTKTGTPLAIGAAIGGVIGQKLFSTIRTFFENPNTVGALQGICMFLITAGTFVYTLKKNGIKTLTITSPSVCLAIGLMLGAMSSFLGIGGGPINLVVLGYFFSMRSKQATQNSLYMILFSQATNLLTIFVHATIPEFDPLTLWLMVAGGIFGGIAGRKFNRRMEERALDVLFLILMLFIMVISLYNTWRYMSL